MRSESQVLDQLSFASLQNIVVLEDLYNRFKQDSSSVDSSFKHFFEGMEFAFNKNLIGSTTAVCAPDSNFLKIYQLITAYRCYGHLKAKVNPVGKPESNPRELDLAFLGFSEEERTLLFPTAGILSKPEATLNEMVAALEDIYCGSVSIEYMNLGNREMERWIQSRIEPSRFKAALNMDQKRMILDQLNRSELLENFIHTKYVGQKRFSIEGCETAIPVLAALIDTGANFGIREVVLGMAHRGRLNVLSNIMQKAYAEIFAEFESAYVPNSFEGSGDKAYHKGFSSDVVSSGGHKVHLSLMPNPSHLECIAAVVQGVTRAKQVQKNDTNHKIVAPIVIHGDAAIAGQGIVYETMQMGKLEGYGVGGVIHLTINNQIGFTTLPEDSRSTRHPTDIAKTFGAPVFHVNAEDPESAIYAANLAAEIRQTFGCDVHIDLNGYRKYGHNEGDEPAFTQPLEYQDIRRKTSIREIYRDKLISGGVLEHKLAETFEKAFKISLEEHLSGAKDVKKGPAITLPTALSEEWTKAAKANSEAKFFEPAQTALPLPTLKELITKTTTIPEGFNVHPKIKRWMQDRISMFSGEKEALPIDWATAEMLAFTSLLNEKVHVRLAGQDARRATFGQRHATWMDQATGKPYFPWSHISPSQAQFTVYNSHLSEFGCLGFELGYSWAYAGALVLWEAQFGDFVNGAQTMIDQFICSAEQKWGRMSGLVMLLPHGFEGMGPEHSSARMERFLQSCAENNIQVANCTTPAQYYHILRRQITRAIKKPLVIFTPKVLLRHPLCISKPADFTDSSFQEVLAEHNPEAKVVILTQGKVHYDVLEERESRKRKDVALVRLEQIYPLHEDKLKAVFASYPQAKDFVFVQEEPENMGAWEFVRPFLRQILGSRGEFRYAGRPRSASPAAGSYAKHKAEHIALMKEAFGS